MSPLTPAQKAVLERIEKKKQLEAKKGLKRRAKAEPAADSTINESAVVDPEPEVGSSKKRRRVDASEPNNNQVEIPALKRGRTASEASTNEAPTSSLKSPVRRGRKTVKPAETSEPEAAEKDAPEVPAAGPAKSIARRGRKTVVIPEEEEKPADQTMNEAQLRVLQMLEEKKANNKGRKSLKPPKEVPPKEEEVVTIDSEESNQELAVSSTVPEPVVRGRRKTTNLEASVSTASTSQNVSVRKRKPPAKVVPVEISEPEEEPPPPAFQREPSPEIRLELEEDEEEEEEDQGPLNATMIAVMERIKEKRAKEPAKKAPAKPKAAVKESPVKTRSAPKPSDTKSSESSKPAGNLTPNQISVMKRLEEKKTKGETIVTLDSSEEEEEPVDQPADGNEQPSMSEEIKSVFDALSIPINHREKHIANRLRNEGVYDAVEKGRPLTEVQTELVQKAQRVLNLRKKKGSPSKTPVPSYDLTRDSRETDAGDDYDNLPAVRPKVQVPAELDSESGSEMEFSETKTGTFLIFDTNAYLSILPYCRAVLESDKLKDSPDYEELKMFALFVVIRELDGISKRKQHLRTPAMAAIRLIHGALQDQNPRIEGQDYASSKEKLDGSTLNDDYILNSADLLQRRGENVVVVTDDKNLQVKIAMMRITSLNCLEFIARFHWLTPLIAADVRTSLLTIGEEALARLMEVVVASIVLKGVLAHLAPLPMERRREIFPSERLSTTLALILKNKVVLQAHTGPFAVLNYDRVAQTLNPLTTYDKAERHSEDRFKYFARFLVSAEVLCRNIAGYFPNMESRAELVGAVGNHFQSYLPENERVAVRKTTIPERTVERPPRWEPASKALLPIKRPAPSAKANIPEPPKVAARSSSPELSSESPEPVRQPTAPRSRRAAASAAAAERSRIETQVSTPEPAPKPRTPRTTRATRARQQEPEQETPADPMYFSFSQGRHAQSNFDNVQEPARPYAITPSKPAASREPVDPYAELQESINEDVTATVYEYFQKFGLSICNYTGSCCVKLGVRFSLAFKVSSARLEGSLQEVTDSFALVLKAMKKIIMGSQTSEPAREFLLHSSQVMDAIGRSDPDLLNSLPKITPDALLSFSKDPEGKQQLVTGCQQFSDFNNCLEKCWL